MDVSFVLLVCGALAATFVAVAYWQSRLDRAQTEANLAKMKEAKSKGQHKAVGLYPLIDPNKCVGCGTCIEACPEDQVIGMVDGIARIVHGSRCIGLALCEKACPVGAITVSLGPLGLRNDIPILSPAQETSVPGLYIAGELSGVGLIRHALDQGAKVVDDIAERIAKDKPQAAPGTYDVLVAGAGPAGLSATLRAIERKLTYKTISQDGVGGTVGKYPRGKMTIVQSVNIPLGGKIPTGVFEKEWIISMWQDILKRHGVVIETGTSLLGAARKPDHFEVQTSQGVVRARYIVLALGRRGTPRRLGVPGEHLNKVLYSLVDASTYANQHVLIVGGGDSAIEAATALAEQEGNVVALSYRKEDFFRLKPRNEQRIKDFIAKKRIHPLLPSEAESIDESSVTLRLPKRNPPQVRLKNDWVFVFAGGELPFPLLKGMGIRFSGEQSAPQTSLRPASA